MINELNTGLKVFSQLYVGITPTAKTLKSHNHRQVEDDYVPLGFATPYEDNTAGRKRQDTVNNWLKSNSQINGKYINGRHVFEYMKTEIKIIDNEPLEGFKVTDDVKRKYYGGGNVVFRIADPRGFEVEIESQNLMALILFAGIQPGGIINGKCCWGRDAGKNILIHESSQEYKNARMAAETIKPLSGLKKSSLQRGSKVLLTNGKIGTYLGRFYCYSYSASYHEYDKSPVRRMSNVAFTNPFNNTITPTRETAYQLNDPVQFYIMQIDGDKELALYRDLKVHETRETINVEMSVEEALKIIDSTRLRPISSTNRSYSTTWFKASESKNLKLKWAEVPLSKDEFNFATKNRSSYNKHIATIANQLSFYELKHPIAILIKFNDKLLKFAEDAGNASYYIDSQDSNCRKNKDLSLTSLVRHTDNLIVVNSPDRLYNYDRSYYMSNSAQLEVAIKDAERMELVMFREDTVESSMETLQLLFDEGRLVKLIPQC
jgi:hypothetical protein